MDTNTKRIIIIGNGIAGLSAAESARKKDQAVKILIISNEKYLTYYRTRIAEIFDADAEHSGDYDAVLNQLIMRNEAWYIERDIELILGKTVTAIDSEKKLITMQDDESVNIEEIFYDKLIITTGASCNTPCIPGVDGKNVHVLRTLDDAQEVAHKLKGIKHAIVVGGGLLGLECAYEFNKKGIETKIVEFKDRLLPNQLDEEGSQVFEDKVLSLGINIIKGAHIVKIEDTNENSYCRKKAMLSNGMQIETDLILFSAGAHPNKEITNGTNIEINHAILVDGYMQTNVKDIFSAGDAAEYRCKWYGLWSVALNQGRVAGHNAACCMESEPYGVDELQEYKPQIPPYFLNSMDTKVSSIGDVGKNHSIAYEAEKNVDRQNHIYQKLYFANKKIVGSILIGDTKKATALGRAIEAGMGKQEVMESII